MSFEAIIAAERRLAASGNVRSGVYENLHRAAQSLLPLNAFYVCLFEPRSQMLQFEYNGDDHRLDTREAFALGDGPTSQVVRSGKSKVFNHRTLARLSTVPFGDVAQPTLAGMHLPLWESGIPGTVPMGVISVQSYHLEDYEREHVRALRYLAVRAAHLIRESQDQVLREETRLISMERSRAEIMARISTVLDVAPLPASEREYILELIRTTVAETTENLPTVGQNLGQRELEAVVLAAQGLTTSQIAERQFVRPETVKSQLKVSFRKLGLNSRVEAAHCLPDLLTELAHRQR